MIVMSNPGMVPSPNNVARASLVADGKTLSGAPHGLGYLEPTDPGLGVEAIRNLHGQHCYVWLKGFFARTDVI